MVNLKKNVCGSLLSIKISPNFCDKSGVATENLLRYFRVSIQGHVLSEDPSIGVRGFPGCFHNIVKIHARHHIDLGPKGFGAVDPGLNTELTIFMLVLKGRQTTAHKIYALNSTFL